MTATYSIRTTKPEDAPLMAVLGAHVWVHTYSAADVSECIAQYVLATFTIDKMRALINDRSRVLFVAEAEANLAGYIVMRLDSYHADVPTEIETLYIQDSFSGLGIGSALLTNARDVAVDVCNGLHSYLRTIEHEASAKPSVNPHVGTLQQLALASTWLLCEHANKKLKSFNEQCATSIDGTKLH